MPQEAPVGGAVANRPGRWLALVLIPLALSAWIYGPLLRVKLFSDDLAHLISIESHGLVDFLFAPFGGHNLFVRNLVFWASWKLFHLHDGFYAAMSLVTHLVNIGLCFAVIRRLAGSHALACFGATLWGTSPLCLGTLGWYSVYGQVMVATIVLSVLHRIAGFVALDATPSRAESLAWYGLLLVGTTCFGIGVGVAVVFPITVFLLLPTTWAQWRTRIWWLSLPVVALALYVGLRRLYLLIGPLTLPEALQELMVRDGLYAVPAMLTHLLAFSAAGSTLGFFMPSAYPSAASWTVSLAFLAGLVVLMVRGSRQAIRRATALLALVVGTYLVIAVGRAHTYALFKIGADVAAKAPRYHYVGSLPMIMLLCLMLREAARLPVLRRIPVPIALGTGLVAIMAGHQVVGLKVTEYVQVKQWVRRTADSIVTDVRAWPTQTTAYLENGTTPRFVLGPALPASAIPGRAGIFVLMQPSDVLEGRTVRFVERDPGVLQDVGTRPKSRLAHLLVGPDQVPRP